MGTVHVMSAWSMYWYTLPLNLTYLLPIPHLLPPRQYDLARKECELYIPEEFLVRVTVTLSAAGAHNDGKVVFLLFSFFLFRFFVMRSCLQ